MIPDGMERDNARSAADSPLHARLDGRRPVDRRDLMVARGRVRWLRRCLDALGERPRSMVTLGWDHGPTSSEFFENLHIRSLVTIDVTREPSMAGELRSADGNATYVHVTDYRASESADLAFTHDVLHQMPAREQAAAAVLVYRSLKAGGLFAMWQTNPWSPGAILNVRARASETSALTPPAARRLLRGGGFDIVHTTSAFFFSPDLTWVQPLLAPIPFGTEYMVLARKP
jgi:hypothetical protein